MAPLEMGGAVMGTCYYLEREDRALFDLDKAYGLVDYLRGDRYPWGLGEEVDLGTDVDALELVLAEHQPYPDGPERRRWAERMIEFAGGKPVRLYDDQSVPETDEEYGNAGYLKRVIGRRWEER